MIMGSTIIFESVTARDATEAIGVYGITGAITNAVSPAVGEFLLSRGLPHQGLFLLSCGFHAAVAYAYVFHAADDKGGHPAQARRRG